MFIPKININKLFNLCIIKFYWRKSTTPRPGPSWSREERATPGSSPVPNAPGTYLTLASAEIYNPATGTWASTAGLSKARSGHTATLLPNGSALVAGGAGSPTNANLTEIYNPATGTWTATNGLNSGRSGHSAVLLNNGKILVAFGTPGDVVTEIYR